MDEKKDKEPLKLKPEFTAAAMSLASAINAYHSGKMRALNICFPAVVRSYDRSTHIAEVVPLIKEGYFDGEWKYVNRLPYKVSVRSIQCGGFTIDIPLYVGDTGWVFSSDRDTLLLKQDGALTSAVLDKDRPLCMVDSAYQQKPAQPLLHDFSRGFFIPDNWGERDPDRFKDNESVNTNGALYIGASFDTKDDDENFDTNEDDTDLLDEDVLEEMRKNRETDETSKTLKKKLQKGEDYEDSLASSLVIERQGGLNILSGSPVQDVALDWRETARLSVHKDTIFSEVMDNRNGAMLQSTISPDGGILVRTFDNYYSSLSGSNTTIEVKDGCAIIQIRKDLIISLKGGNITIYTESGATINSNGNINVESEKDVTIFGGGTVMAKEGAEISAKDYVSVNSTLLSINSGRDVTIETAEKLELSGRVNFRCNDTLKLVGKKIDYRGPVGGYSYSIGNGKEGKIKIDSNGILGKVRNQTRFQITNDGIVFPSKYGFNIDAGKTLNVKANSTNLDSEHIVFSGMNWTYGPSPVRNIWTENIYNSEGDVVGQSSESHRISVKSGKETERVYGFLPYSKQIVFEDSINGRHKVWTLEEEEKKAEEKAKGNSGNG